jgi:DNA-directed RNA polymerase specialized sigma24 family protein
MDRSRAATSKKSNWIATEGSFAALLEWLDQGFDTNGEAYLEVRRRLVAYFDRKGCRDADALADETLNRVQRRLEEEGSIESESPAKFCYAVAKFVFLEYVRSGRAREVPEEQIDKASTANAAWQGPDDDDIHERESSLRCLERCMAELDEQRRELVIGYYQGELRAKIENRRRLAAKLGLTLNALSIRTFRIRERLENCVRKCIDRAK